MEVQVKNSKGEESGVIELADVVWAAKMNGPVLHQVVNAQRANRRQGGHDTKTRSDIIGSGRKLGRQKGAGRARHGDRKSPTMRGGGVAHGPHPRSYRQRIPTKVRRLALRVALSDQLRRGNVSFVEDLGISAPRTKDLSKILQAISHTERLLLITTGENEVIRKSAKNLTDVEVQTADLLNPLQVTGARHLLFTQDAAHRVDEIWSAPAAKPARKAVEA